MYQQRGIIHAALCKVHVCRFVRIGIGGSCCLRHTRPYGRNLREGEVQEG